jgi:hypothetical protein
MDSKKEYRNGHTKYQLPLYFNVCLQWSVHILKLDAVFLFTLPCELANGNIV